MSKIINTKIVKAVAKCSGKYRNLEYVCVKDGIMYATDGSKAVAYNLPQECDNALYLADVLKESSIDTHVESATDVEIGSYPDVDKAMKQKEGYKMGATGTYSIQYLKDTLNAIKATGTDRVTIKIAAKSGEPVMCLSTPDNTLIRAVLIPILLK